MRRCEQLLRSAHFGSIFHPFNARAWEEKWSTQSLHVFLSEVFVITSHLKYYFFMSKYLFISTGAFTVDWKKQKWSQLHLCLLCRHALQRTPRILWYLRAPWDSKLNKNIKNPLIIAKQNIHERARVAWFVWLAQK